MNASKEKIFASGVTKNLQRKVAFITKMLRRGFLEGNLDKAYVNGELVLDRKKVLKERDNSELKTD